MPFVVATRTTISDRGLGRRSRDGDLRRLCAYYRESDGIDLSAAVPAHGTSTITESDPTVANTYDSNSAGGLFAIDTLDQSAGLARVDGSSATDVCDSRRQRSARVVRYNGGSSAATRGVLDGTLPGRGGSLDLRGVIATGMAATAAALRRTLVVPISRSSLSASVSMTRTGRPQRARERRHRRVVIPRRRDDVRRARPAHDRLRHLRHRCARRSARLRAGIVRSRHNARSRIARKRAIQ